MAYISVLLLSFFSLSLSSPLCTVNTNFCKECHPITNLCIQCQYDNMITDDNGGCIGSKKCSIGDNYCYECSEDSSLCSECEIGYYPDQNGGCTYVENCEISYNGHCVKCLEDYYLIGNELKICKFKELDDFQNCKQINYTNGLCSVCEDGYFLNSGDKKCVSIEHCLKSSFNVCIQCDKNYILNKQEDICEKKSESFLNCKITLDNETCDECDDGFYFSEDGKCIKTNYCQKSDNNNCLECKNGYFLSDDKLTCTKEEKCLTGTPGNGLCNWCLDNYYLEYKDRKCRSNLEKEELINCKVAKNEICKTCEKNYYLGEDNRCSISQHCAESENQLCISCSEGYYLGKDGKCTNVKRCIYSRNNECYECEDGYYYDRIDKKCNKAFNNFLNCKYNSEYDQSKCSMCKDDYYLLLSESLCYSNKEEGPFYKCQMSNYNGNNCSSCVGEYHLGRDDLKCNLIEGCLRSKNATKCLECDRYYCLDKKGNCVDNYYITEKEKAFYYYCKNLNEEGTGCAECENDLIPNDEGICYDEIHCEEKDNKGICKKCQSNNPFGYLGYCLNKIYGCVDTFLKNCIRCDNLLELDWCTECEKGYEIDEYGDCIKNNDE